MELLILRTDLLHKVLCGVKANGNTYRHGATSQMAAGLFFGVLFSWLILPFFLAIIFLRNYVKIDTF
jgi:hypothetical protein